MRNAMLHFSVKSLPPPRRLQTWPGPPSAVLRMPASTLRSSIGESKVQRAVSPKPSRCIASCRFAAYLRR
ncbi:hypothetical protein C8T65DRAFT_673038 [Cerioporus squamosus]|nr:hypothetical protein C8T65DRAFT_673038 [Cerioporus squamosus]